MSMKSTDEELLQTEQSIQQLQTEINGNQESLRKYEEMPQTEITWQYIYDLRQTIFTLSDLLERLQRKKHRLINYKFHNGKWWKCPYCGTSNPPSRTTCGSCI